MLNLSGNLFPLVPSKEKKFLVSHLSDVYFHSPCAKQEIFQHSHMSAAFFLSSLAKQEMITGLVTPNG
jgi:hypothetical protein